MTKIYLIISELKSKACQFKPSTLIFSLETGENSDDEEEDCSEEDNSAGIQIIEKLFKTILQDRFQIYIICLSRNYLSVQLKVILSDYFYILSLT